MPQIKPALALIALCLGGALALAGCGDENSKASFGPETGKHVAGWITAHDQAALADVNACVECHGENLDGRGISKVACSQCHPESPFEVHPLVFGQLAYARHVGYVAANGTSTCTPCHGANLQGGAAPSCGISCHMAINQTTGQPQKHAWLAANTSENIDGHLSYFATNPRNYTSCRNHACHGGEGTNAIPPGVFLSGPGCIGNGCHTAGAGNPVPAEAP
jgi:hypothetical protein